MLELNIKGHYNKEAGTWTIIVGDRHLTDMTQTEALTVLFQASKRFILEGSN